jgi:hypothetical protein
MGVIPVTTPTPSDKSEGFSNAAKVLGGAVALVVAAAGTLGTATGGLAFLFRNNPGWFIAALVLAILAAAAATWAAYGYQRSDAMAQSSQYELDSS